MLENTGNKHWIYHPREAKARGSFDTAVAEARKEMARTRLPMTAQAAKETLDDILGVNRSWSGGSAPVKPPAPNDPNERLQRYWRKLDKGMVIHLPNPGAAASAAALHRMDQGFNHKGIVIQAICARHEDPFNLHLSPHALTHFPTTTLDSLGELNRPTLVICFGNLNEPYECMWVNQQPGYTLPVR